MRRWRQEEKKGGAAKANRGELRVQFSSHSMITSSYVWKNATVEPPAALLPDPLTDENETSSSSLSSHFISAPPPAPSQCCVATQAFEDLVTATCYYSHLPLSHSIFYFLCCYNIVCLSTLASFFLLPGSSVFIFVNPVYPTVYVSSASVESWLITHKTQTKNLMHYCWYKGDMTC